MEKITIINYLGVIAVISVIAFAIIFSMGYWKHLEDKDDKGYRLCLVGIIKDVLTWDAENGCLETYGVKIKADEPR